MIKKFISLFDLQDIQLVTGISMLGYGLFLVYPPSAFIVVGLLFIAPSVPQYFKRAK
jgi:hypothetical protein